MGGEWVISHDETPSSTMEGTRVSCRKTGVVGECRLALYGIGLSPIFPHPPNILLGCASGALQKMKIQYQLWDVFTNRQLSGNQLAVIPDADNLDDVTMQRIANEFSLSETVFVVASIAPQCHARLRIFTPERELPMAGHPTIGATFALAASGRFPDQAARLFLQLEIGPTLVELDWNGKALHAAWMSQRAPEFGPLCDDAPALARLLRVDTSDVLAPMHPGQIVSSGLPLLFVPLNSRSAVDRAVLDRSELTNICTRMMVSECPVYIFSVEKGDDDSTTYSRMFAPVFGIAEDPATGGASGPLGAYVAKHWPRLIPKNRPLVNWQGVKMGRPSRILISISNSNPEPLSVRVGGQAVYVGQGELYLN